MARRSTVELSDLREVSAVGIAAGTSTVDRIIVHIKDALKRGRLAPGQRLVEADIQAEVGASRGSVREALRKLSSDGLVELHLHKGARVRRLTRAEVESVYDIREVLEGLAARLATRNIEEAAFVKHIKKLETAFDTARDGSVRTYMAFNEGFHQAILALCRDENLVRMVGQLQVPTFMLRLYTIVDARRIAQAHQQHGRIIAAMLARDEMAAERAMRNHISATKRFVIEKGAHLLD